MAHRRESKQICTGLQTEPGRRSPKNLNGCVLLTPQRAWSSRRPAKRSASFWSCPVPQLHAADFAADGFRQFGHEFDLARMFVRRGDFLAMLDQFLFADREPLSQHDEGFHNLTAHRARLADD